MPPATHPYQRSWIRFLSHLLAGNPSVATDLNQALDMTVAFCGCRAATLFAPQQGGGLDVRASSAILREDRDDLQPILGPRRDAAPFACLAWNSSPGFSSVAGIVHESELIPLRGVALRLESLAVSVHPSETASMRGGFALFWWEEECPDAGRLGRAQLAALALCAGLESQPQETAELRPHATGAGVTADARPGKVAADAKKTHSKVLKELDALAREEPDPLTELALHSSLLSALDSAVTQARKEKEPLALILIDTDDLAEINRVHGPRAGDEVLRNIAAILLEETGSEDLAVRYGMEEFALLVRDNPDKVKTRALEIQRKVIEQALPGPRGESCGSVSVGVACLPDPLAESPAALRLKAEQALDLARQHRPGGLIIL